MKKSKKIEYKLKQLTPELVEELDRYLDYLLSKQSTGKRDKKLNQDWAGGLKDEDFNSIELQKKALDWRKK